MESVYLIEAQYRGGYRIFLRFNTGKSLFELAPA